MTSPADPAPETEATSKPAEKKPFPVRLAIQIGVAAFGLYLIGSGLYGLWKGGNPDAPQQAAPLSLAPSCKVDPAILAGMKKAAIGDVAGFSVNAEPKMLGNFTFKAPDGTARAFADFQGKVILVNLWATWCAPCRKEMPALDELQRGRGGKDFEVVAVNVDTREPEKAPEFLDEIGVTSLTRYQDSSGGLLQDMKKANRAPGLPTTVLLDGKGCELGFLLGPAEWAGKDALALVDAALGKTK